jgi:hypothetical protein
MNSRQPINTIASIILVTLALCVARSCTAALIQTYDLDTLCYMSSDVVVATITRDHVAGQQPWQDRFTATVVDPIEGQYHAGDKQHVRRYYQYMDPGGLLAQGYSFPFFKKGVDNKFNRTRFL